MPNAGNHSLYRTGVVIGGRGQQYQQARRKLLRGAGLFEAPQTLLGHLRAVVAFALARRADAATNEGQIIEHLGASSLHRVRTGQSSELLRVVTRARRWLGPLIPRGRGSGDVAPRGRYGNTGQVIPKYDRNRKRDTRNDDRYE